MNTAISTGPSPTVLLIAITVICVVVRCSTPFLKRIFQPVVVVLSKAQKALGRFVLSALGFCLFLALFRLSYAYGGAFCAACFLVWWVCSKPDPKLNS